MTRSSNTTLSLIPPLIPRSGAMHVPLQSQLVYHSGGRSETVIELNLRHPGSNDRNVTTNHNWAIFVNPVGHDAAVKFYTSRCTAGGYRWNPDFIHLANPNAVS